MPENISENDPTKEPEKPVNAGEAFKKEMTKEHFKDIIIDDFKKDLVRKYPNLSEKEIKEHFESEENQKILDEMVELFMKALDKRMGDHEKESKEE